MLDKLSKYRGSSALYDITKGSFPEPRVWGLGGGRVTYVVRQGCVTVGLRQQQPDHVGVAVLARAHQRRGALVVLEVDVRAASQEGLHHGHPTVANR